MKTKEKEDETRWEIYLINWQITAIPASIRFICRDIKDRKRLILIHTKSTLQKQGFDNLHHAEGILLEAQKKSDFMVQKNPTF